MRLECRHCRRAFEIDEARVGVGQEKASAFRCVCNERLDLAEELSNSTKPRLGKYVLVNRIATGGMGEIYYGKVSGAEGFEKEVAIKRMLSHLSSDRDFVEMMVKEAKLTVLLNHPNIVGIYDLAREGDEYYIAMEYVPGVTVGAILEQLRRHEELMPPEVAVHITMSVLRGLSYAHNLIGPRGDKLTILHRDITPQNILVTRQAFVKITDFGIAKALNEITTTSAGMIKGKLGYIAPEQLEGKEPDHRIDLFCAGILLWEMLMARRLFKGTTELDTFRLISECKVTPPASLRSGISPALNTVVMRCLLRDPDHRYLQGEDFIAALAQAILPRSIDDVARDTAKYLASHPEFFTAIAGHKGAVVAEAHGAIPTHKLPPITDFLTVPTAGGGRKIGGVPAAPAPAEAAAPTPPGVGPPPVPGGTPSYGTAMPTGTLPYPAQRNHLQTTMIGFAIVLMLANVVLWRYQLSQIPAPLVVTSFSSEPSPEGGGSPGPAPVVPAPAPVVPVAAPAPAPAPASPPPRRVRHEPALRPLRSEEIQATIQRRQADIGRCLSNIDLAQAPAQVEAQITIEPSGLVSAVGLVPPLADPAGRCLSRALKRLHFRRHPTPGFKVTIPLTLKEGS